MRSGLPENVLCLENKCKIKHEIIILRAEEDYEV